MMKVTLDGTDFPLKAEPPPGGALLVLGRREARGGKHAMAGLLDFLEQMLDDHDPDEFEQAIARMDFDDVQAALESALESYRQDPTSAVPESSQDSEGGRPTDEPTSRVVSLSRGTVEFRDRSAG